MSTNIAGVIILIQSLQQVAAGKFCVYTYEGVAKYFYCSAHEYCCGTHCCESFSHFYRLWYFWFCVMLAMMFCSGSGYWYKRRYNITQQRFLVGQPQNDPVVTMTTSQTTTTNGTCTRIPTGMTYQPSCHPAMSTSPPAYSSTDTGMVLANQPAGHQLVHIAPDGSVLYQALPYGPPPSYDSVYQIANQRQEQQAPPPFYQTIANQQAQLPRVIQQAPQNCLPHQQAGIFTERSTVLPDQRQAKSTSGVQSQTTESTGNQG